MDDLLENTTILHAATTRPVNAESVVDLILSRVRLLSRIRIKWLQSAWSESKSEKGSFLHELQELKGYLNNIDDPVAEQLWLKNNEVIRPELHELAEIVEALEEDQSSRLSFLCAVFDLDEIERDLLHACLTLYLEPGFGHVYAYLQDNADANYVTLKLVTRLFHHESLKTISHTSSLQRWNIIKEINNGNGNPLKIECDPFIIHWLLGETDLEPILMDVSKIQPIHDPMPHWPVKETINEIARIIDREANPCIRVNILGSEGSGRKSFAAGVSSALGLRLMMLDVDRIPDQQWTVFYLHAQRQAFLNRVALLWKGDSIFEKFWPYQHASFNLQFIITEQERGLVPDENFIDLKVVLPEMEESVRFNMLKQFLPDVKKWPAEQVSHLIRRHRPTIGQLTFASHQNAKTIEEITAHFKEYARRHLGKLAQLMQSDFTWNDLVVPGSLKKQLEDFAFEAEDRDSLWKEHKNKRLFPQGKGLVALFTGIPGTGKTMAAQVIANSLDRDLFRVDISAVVSKYVGETSKNIEKILSRANSMNVILLFDEADALFGKRTEIKDANDRFANTDTNYLLQALEAYSGIIILASNKKANMDSGFTRRIRFIVDFQKPDGALRYHLWHQLITELGGAQVADSMCRELQILSQTIEITGAQIKMAILSAVFISRKENTTMNIQHILGGLERELLKEGRGLGKQIYETLNKQP